MADEQLRMTAEVVDKFSTPLRKLRDELRGVKTPEGVRSMESDFAKLGKSVGAAAAEIRGVVLPAISGLGIGAISASGAVAALVASIRGFSSATAALSAFSRESGISIERFKALEKLGERFEIAPEQMKAGVQKFASNMHDIRRRISDVYGLLKDTNPLFAEQLFNSKNTDEALGRAFAFIAKIENPIARMRMAEKLFGNETMGRLGADGLKGLLRQWGEVQKSMQSMPTGADKAAKEFEESLKGIRETMESFKDKALAQAIVDMVQPLKEGAAILRDAIAAYERVIAKLKGAKESVGNPDIGTMMKPWTWWMSPFMPKDKTAELEAARKKLADHDAEVAKRGDGAPGARALWDGRRRLLEEDVKRLERALKEGVKEGLNDAILQKQNFSGSIGGLGGLIQNASFGGAGGGVGGVGGGGRFNGIGAGAGGGGGGAMPSQGNGDGSPGATAGSLTALIDAEAKRAGIDLRIMHGIRAGESHRSAKYDVKDDALESSWGPFQLNRRKGLGVQFEKATAEERKRLGLGDLRDPRTIGLQARWVADFIAKGGSLRNWMGYRGPRNADPRWGDSGYTPHGTGAERNTSAFWSNDFSGLRKKPGAGTAKTGVLALAKQLQDEGILKYVSALKDEHHKGGRSYHNLGLAMDAAIRDPRKSTQAAGRIKQLLQGAGLAPGDFTVLDEYKNRSPRWTGPHIHANFRSDAAAAKFAEWYSERQSQGMADGLRRSGDAMMMRGAASQKVEGDAKLSIDLKGFPKGTAFSTEASGMFKQVHLDRGRQMAEAEN